MDYRTYLLQNDYSESTVEGYQKNLVEFTKWLKEYQLKINEIDYKNCLKYVQYLQRKNIKVATINNYLLSVRSYFNYQIMIDERVENPLKEVYVRGTIKRVLHNLLEPDELEDLYYSCETEKFSKHSNFKAKLSAKRNKVITGLLIYQGLNTTNLKSLLLEHLELYKGKIYIPSTRRSNSRTMELKSWQVLDLLEYVNEIRPQIMKYNKLDNEQLFIPQNHFSDLLKRKIIIRLKKINYKVTNVHHLRASVIVNWLNQYNIRKVQYLAGHRYISSTEAYKQNNLESLHEAINEFHPLS